ncbi:uncharacterized protein LOC132551551 [Ylistrum balloti]|uniref:uncharacterized protein LOC132551551 n=1 Tax=Ylistrum balloti TaxID=509963 RepID=UPI002905A19E|nr:uncharacterized protein LOC132551551 [Ylistrum balloti]
MTILYLRPSEIRYSQDSVAYYFGQGRYSGISIGQTLDELLLHKCHVNDIPTITVSLHNGLWYCGDNRRLWVFRKCEELGIIDSVPAYEGYINPSKFTTFNQGVSIRVRGSPGGREWTRRNRKNLVIKEPEPPKPVRSPVFPVPATTICHESVVEKVVQDDFKPSIPELSDSSESLTDIKSISDHSDELEPSQSEVCSEHTGSSLQCTPCYVKYDTTEGQVNPVFYGDEDGQQCTCDTTVRASVISLAESVGDVEQGHNSSVLGLVTSGNSDTFVSKCDCSRKALLFIILAVVFTLLILICIPILITHV